MTTHESTPSGGEQDSEAVLAAQRRLRAANDAAADAARDLASAKRSERAGAEESVDDQNRVRFYTGPGGSRDLRNLFSYHPPTPEQIPLYERMRKAGHDLAVLIEDLAPPSPERSTALAKVRESIMWANAAVACNPAPAAGSTAPSDT